MSSRFVFSEEINSEELSKEQENEKQLQQDLDQKETQKERKSLQQQLYANRIRRYKEFKQKMDNQNSSYKLKTDVLKYYNSLQTKQKDKLENEKRAEKEALNEFRRLNQANSENEVKDVDDLTSEELDEKHKVVVSSLKRSSSPLVMGIRKKVKSNVKVKEEEMDLKLESSESALPNNSNNSNKSNKSILNDHENGKDINLKETSSDQDLFSKKIQSASTDNGLCLGYSSESD